MSRSHRMRVVQVLFSGLGGHESVASAIVRGDTRRQWQHRFVFYGLEPLAAGYAESCEARDVGYDVVQKQAGVDLGSWRQVMRRVEDAEPDAIIVHSVNLVLPLVAAAKRLRVPVVFVDHLSNAVKRPKDWIFTTLTLALGDAVVYLTKQYRDEVFARLGIAARLRRVEVIGNAVDLRNFQPNGSRKEGPFRIGMHSRFSHTKDHATVLRAAALLPDAEVVLAGDGETHAQCRALARTLGLADRTRFVGLLPETALPSFLASLDVYVHGTFGETMSTAVMQAMASGLPVVASDVAGMRPMIRHGIDGLLVPARDAEKFADAIRGLSASRSSRERLGAAARAHAEREWSEETAFHRYDALLRRLLA